LHGEEDDGDQSGGRTAVVFSHDVRNATSELDAAAAAQKTWRWSKRKGRRRRWRRRRMGLGDGNGNGNGSRIKNSARARGVWGSGTAHQATCLLASCSLPVLCLCE
jgi:hypothetical protein